MRRLIYILPLLILAVVAAFFFLGFNRDPKLVPSPMIGKPAPEFSVPGLRGSDGSVSNASFEGKVTLLNFFASWCVPCRVEHPLLMDLARNKSVRIVGVDYKDKPEDALVWLRQLGDPYGVIGADRDGRAAIDWGVYGVPESYIIDKQGVIRFKQVGPITEDVWRTEMAPLIKELSK
ncbi:MAG TPA: DsbE family thiol:disulfide interchange protein [Azospirillum sp.]|nr:DsbE family thiol:disulfide interchange protein [Azospirillum sp.]